MSILLFVFWTVFVMGLGFLLGEYVVKDRVYPYRLKCDGTCYEDIPFRIASNERSFAQQAMTVHLEDQHEEE